MQNSTQDYLFAYDSSSKSRRKQLKELARTYAYNTQYSAFQISLTPAEYNQLLTQAKHIIADTNDAILLIKIRYPLTSTPAPTLLII
jgi:CRISPR-associated endonuclease Cas2